MVHQGRRKFMAGKHDTYGKFVLRKAAGWAYADSGPSVMVQFGGAGAANIDGTVNRNIAVEIESRVTKQIRGALMDLILHPYSKKLLVLLPVHMSNPDTAVAQCKYILKKFLSPADFQVILLQGTGSDSHADEDVPIVRQALKKLGYNSEQIDSLK
jgi:hypothetical protein